MGLMKVTLNTILEGKEYAPVPGTQYDIAEGKIVTLKRPTYGLRKEFVAYVDDASQDGYSDVEAAKMVTEGEWPDDEECDPSVVSRICEDFFSAATPTWRKDSPLSTALQASASTPAPSPMAG